MRLAKIACAGALAGMLALVPGARADEEKVALKDVPKAVMDAVQKKFPGAELVEAEKEVEEGKTTFEVELKDKGRSIDVSLKPNGTILEIETEVAAKDLPKAVTEALMAKYPGATIKEAEEVVTYEGDKEVKAYEVKVTTAAKKSFEVKVSTDGKVGKAEEAEEDDKD